MLCFLTNAFRCSVAVGDRVWVTSAVSPSREQISYQSHAGPHCTPSLSLVPLFLASIHGVTSQR